MTIATSTSKIPQLATSTCNVSGANQICTYTYRDSFTYATQTQDTVTILNATPMVIQPQATSTYMFETTTTIIMFIGLFVTIVAFTTLLIRNFNE